MKENKKYVSGIKKYDTGKENSDGYAIKRYQMTLDFSDHEVHNLARQFNMTNKNDKFKWKKDGNRLTTAIHDFLVNPDSVALTEEQFRTSMETLIRAYKTRNDIPHRSETTEGYPMILLSRRKSETNTNQTVTITASLETQTIFISFDCDGIVVTTHSHFLSRASMLLWFIGIDTEKDLYKKLHLSW